MKIITRGEPPKPAPKPAVPGKKRTVGGGPEKKVEKQVLPKEKEEDKE